MSKWPRSPEVAAERLEKAYETGYQHGHDEAFVDLSSSLDNVHDYEGRTIFDSASDLANYMGRLYRNQTGTAAHMRPNQGGAEEEGPG